MACLTAAGAGAADVQLTAEVPAGQWKAMRLKGLTKNASLAVRVDTSGPIRVILAREDEVQRFPKGLKAAFAGRAERRLAFRVTLPVAGTYYVILDNRKGEAQRDVRIAIRALAAPPPRKKAPASAPAEKLEAI